MTFDAWLGKVDDFLLTEVGLSHMDLEDWLWHDTYSVPGR